MDYSTGVEMSKRVVQISTVHSWQDPRIFYKQCRSLADHGYEVHLITNDGIDEIVNGVMVHPISKQTNGRIDRYLNATRAIYSQAKNLQPDVIHFHDPELITGGLRAAKEGWNVIYDIHEDNTTSIHQREYIPAFIKNLLGRFIDHSEQKAHKRLHTIIAEKYYSRRFPDAVPILNYPDLDLIRPVQKTNSHPALIYTGNIRIERGALIHANILNEIPSVELHQIGKCTPRLENRLKKETAANKNRLRITGVDRFVPYPEIVAAYNIRSWLAGLAVFPYDPHFEEKHLTKFFEYMAAGIPIIYSNFSEWKKLLEPLNVGICVNPENSSEAAEAVNKLLQNPGLWKQYSDNGKRHAAKSFSWRSEKEKLLSFYKMVTEAET